MESNEDVFLSSTREWLASQCWCFSGEECSKTFTAAQNEALVIVPLSGAVLSTFGSVFIITSYVCFVKLRSLPQRLVLCLSTADLFSSLSYFVGVSSVSDTGGCGQTGRCSFAAFLNILGGLSSLTWTIVIAVNCYNVLVRELGERAKRYEPRYHLLAWGVPSVVALCATLTTTVSAASSSWCGEDPSTLLVRGLVYYLPLLLAFMFVLGVSTRISIAMRGSARRGQITFRLFLYLLVFVVIRLFALINRVAEYGGSTVFTLYLLQAIFSPLTGALNALVYGFNPPVREEWSRELRLIWSETRRRGSDWGRAVVQALVRPELKLSPSFANADINAAETRVESVDGIEITVLPAAQQSLSTT